MPRFLTATNTCPALFDRAFGKLRVLVDAELIRPVEFLDALDDYDITLTCPAG